MINDYINQLNMNWNRKTESVQNTILADILEGLWEVCEDIHYDNLATKSDSLDYYKDDPTWYN
jgi:hypothetical protein